MARWPSAPKYVIVAPDGRRVEGMTHVGKPLAIREFLLAAGHRSSEIALPPSKEKVWKVYKDQGFSCMTEEHFNSITQGVKEAPEQQEKAPVPEKRTRRQRAE
jgi:hypothetical protein